MAKAKTINSCRIRQGKRKSETLSAYFSNPQVYLDADRIICRFRLGSSHCLVEEIEKSGNLNPALFNSLFYQ